MNIKPSNSNRSAAGQAAETGSSARPDQVAAPAPMPQPALEGSVELSAGARAFLKFRDQLNSLPVADRTAQVMSLRSSIEAGTYNVPSHEIAGAILRDTAARAMLDMRPRP
jgi:flagellar biosynthesis anti-sigma factor FlgM